MNKEEFLAQAIPTAIVDLPSKGEFYNETNPLSKGTVEVKYPTARQEDILTNVTYLEKGIAIDKLIESVIVTPNVNIDTILLGDKVALSIAIRILAYGKTYRYKEFTVNEETTEESEVTKEIDLTSLKTKELPDKIEKHYVEGRNTDIKYELPLSKNVITFQLLTQEVNDRIEKLIDQAKEKDSLESSEVSSRLKALITSVGGQTDQDVIDYFVDNFMVTEDIKSFYKYYYKVTPGYDMKVSAKNVATGEEEVTRLNLGINFYWSNEDSIDEK